LTRPEDWLRRTQAESAAALQLKGVVPVLKMSMKCFWRVKGSKTGRVSDRTPPSTATPQAMPATGVTAAVAGRSNTARLRGFEDIMYFHLPPATPVLKYSVSVSMRANAARTRLA
jgi:hypothetical protein